MIYFIFFIFIQLLSEKPEIKQIDFQTHNGYTEKLEQGFLSVYENRMLKQRKIKLAFIRFKSKTKNPGAPAFYLQGGPGSSGINTAKGSLFLFFKALSKDRDVIVVDQRGTGLSEPNLNSDVSIDIPTDPEDDIEKAIREKLKNVMMDVRNDYASDGIELSSYNSEENAEDIYEIGQSLGYQKIILIGHSYGTELALFIMKNHESYIDRAIMMGSVSPEQDYKLPLQFHQQFVLMDSLMRQDQRISKYIPSFLSLVKSVHFNLKKNPASIKVPLMDAVSDDDFIVFQGLFQLISLFKPYWEMTMTDFHFQLMVQNYIGYNRYLPLLPLIYYEIKQGKYNRIGNILRNFRRRPLGNVMAFSTNSHTRYTDQRFLLAKEQDQHVFLKSHAMSVTRSKDMLDLWGKPAVNFNTFKQFKSAIPVLFIAGTLDRRTPYENTIDIMKRFSNVQLITIENGSHNNQIFDETIKEMSSFLKAGQVRKKRFHLSVSFLAPVAYKHDLQALLYKKLKTASIKEMILAYDLIYSKYRNQTDYIYDLREVMLNRLGYQLLEEEAYDEAVAVFELNVRQFPDQFNTYDSLAEAYYYLKKYKLALKFYHKSLEINGLNINATMMIQRIENEL